MFKWLNSDTVRAAVIGQNTSDTGNDHIHLFFTQWMIERGLPVHNSRVEVRGANFKNLGLVKMIADLDAKIVSSDRAFHGVYTKCYGWEEGYIVAHKRSNKYHRNDIDDGEDDEDPDSITFSIYTINEDTLKFILKSLKVINKPKANNEGKVHVLISGRELGTQSLGVAGVEFIPGNYNTNVVNDYAYTIGQLNAKDPNGRIVILDGPPGTGKTTLVKSIIKDVPKATFLIIPSNSIELLASPDFMTFFIKNRETLLSPVVLVIEDADRCLVPRGADNISVISTLLNMTDGIVGHLLNLRVLATTNAAKEEIDPAILRPGRLIKHTHVGLLYANRATDAYNRISGNNLTFDVPTTLAEVYYKARSGNPEALSNRIVPRKVGFGS